jgi:putative hydrolase of the HAD superfamily
MLGRGLNARKSMQPRSMPNLRKPPARWGAGHAPSRGADVIAVLAGDVRPAMVATLDALKAAGYALGCITNNVPSGKGAGMAMTEARAAEVAAVMTRFDHIIESSKAGVRKPDPRIYAMMCEALGVAPSQCVYLDDLGINCKPAAAMGMRAIKVTGEAQALAELADMLGTVLPG